MNKKFLGFLGMVAISVGAFFSGAEKANGQFENTDYFEMAVGPTRNQAPLYPGYEYGMPPTYVDNGPNYYLDLVQDIRKREEEYEGKHFPTKPKSFDEIIELYEENAVEFGKKNFKDESQKLRALRKSLDNVHKTQLSELKYKHEKEGWDAVKMMPNGRYPEFNANAFLLRERNQFNERMGLHEFQQGMLVKLGLRTPEMALEHMLEVLQNEVTDARKVAWISHMITEAEILKTKMRMRQSFR